MLLILGILVFNKYTNGQEMITDFVSGDTDKGSSPSGFVEFREMMFFQAITEGYGREIWVTNGNENEVFILKDIYPGSNSGIQTLLSKSSVILNNTLYFIANDGTSNGEIWKTDGTTEGTEKMTDFLNSGISELTLVGSNFYFLIKSSDSLQVWISDGSKAGTKIVRKDLPISNSPSFQGKCNNTFIFTFQSFGSTFYSRVWRSDGTASGTYPITGEIDGNGAGLGGTPALSHYIEYNNELYFLSRENLFKTDGTLENTVIGFNPLGGYLIEYGDAVVANSKLYFSFFNMYDNRLLIWEYDVTESADQIIYDKSGDRYFMPSNLLANDNALIFCGVNNDGGTSLIKLNLNDHSLNYIKELEDTPRTPFIFIEYIDACDIQFIGENKVFCSVPDENYYLNGWISGLSEESTINFQNLLNVENMFSFEDSYYYSCNYNEMEGSELWKYNGAGENFYMVDNINKSRYGLRNQQLINLNSDLIFAANDGITGEEIWKYNQGSTLLKDIRKGYAGSYCNYLTRFDNNIFFNSNDSIHGFELWKTNGTETGTMIFYDLLEGTGSSNPENMTIHNGNLYFIAKIDGHDQLFKCDGNNIEMIKDLGQELVKEMCSSADYLYLATWFGLWISDGTSQGSYLLKDFGICRNLTDVDGKLYFVASESWGGDEELWSTDGTESGTRLVKDICVEQSSQPDHLICYNGELVFTSNTAENGREIWKSDGTENGTKQMVDITPGTKSSLQNPNFCIANNILFFVASEGENGFELWKTDGTESGTTLVKDINPGIEGSFPNALVSIKDLLYFQAYDAEHGSELWKSDGTESGTVMVADILPGVLSSLPTNICLIDNDVLFIAESADKGRQIWKMPYNSISSSNESLEKPELTIFPNPCFDLIHFNAKVEKICIYSSLGNLINVIKPENSPIDISELPSGLYLMKFKIDGIEINKKIIKK